MSGSLFILLLAAVTAGAPVTLNTELHHNTLRVEIQLHEPLPENLETALPSGAEVAVTYLVRVRSARKVWWDKRVWKGEAVASSIFDPVTGRFRCDLVVDGVIVSSREAESIDDARRWLTSPETVRFAMPEDLKKTSLRVRVRAVFSSSTKWLFFPDVEGTEWVEVPIEDPEGPNRGTES
jgi:hypothetical protein